MNYEYCRGCGGSATCLKESVIARMQRRSNLTNYSIGIASNYVRLGGLRRTGRSG